MTDRLLLESLLRAVGSKDVAGGLEELRQKCTVTPHLDWVHLVDDLLVRHATHPRARERVLRLIRAHSKRYPAPPSLPASKCF